MKHKSVFMIIGVIASLLTYYALINEYNSTKVDTKLENNVEFIRNDLLKYTPIGTPENEVMFFIKNKLHYKSPGNPRYWGDLSIPGKKLSKEIKIIRIMLGSYGHKISSLFLLGTMVETAWIFDDSDNLTDIRVWKTGDAL